ncbi:hypothetical protein KPL70_027261 [Citrus sinensis]|nr:hypothetical protein KPL70_027261 [Citrus sinensis]
MLCLKAEALDDQNQEQEQNYYHQNLASSSSPSSSTGNSNGNSFILPINLASSIHRFLWKKGRSFSSGDGFLTSSDFEVKQLQKQLQEEIDLRLALASAVEHSDSTSNSTCQLPDKAQELLDSIAVLEITVSKLEQDMEALQYQLSQERNERRLAEYRLRHLSSPASSLSNCSPAHLRELITRPYCGLNDMNVMATNQVTVAMQKNDYFMENLWHHPCHLSEEMVLCMRDIFLFLGDSSKSSSFEHMASSSSPQGHLSYSSLASFSDSPIMNPLARSPSVDINHDSEVFARDCVFDPYGVLHKGDLKRSIGIYGMAIEVSCLSVGKKELEYAAMALKRFRLLLEHLARVDISFMSCNEKLAFWINLYNALIMHAYLAYGVPTSEMKFLSLIQKALVLALQKFKVSEELKKYSIDHPEPLLSFALSCGMHSSPAVRIFRPENVTELLKESLTDYVQASVGITNKGKLLVPKLLHCYAKGIVEDSMLRDWICQFLSPEQAAMVRDCSPHQKWSLLGARGFSVLPFDSRFRYLFLMQERNQ